jgi:F-type H+-transporting ATPase subunit b
MKAALYSFMFATLVPTVQAASNGAHHEPSIADLTYPAINFIVLAGFLIWKLKGSMREMFNKKAADVQSLMASAAQKNKDAETRLAELQAKMKNLDAEVNNIVSEYHRDVANFTTAQAQETQGVISRTKRDLENKLEGERNELVEQMNQDLLNTVIAKTQETIKNNGDMKSRATKNIVSGLR